MEPAVHCSSCAGPLPRTFDRTCPRCGWDNQVAVRKCLHCKAMISLNETLTYRAIAGSMIVLGLASGYFLGPQLGGAIGLAIGSICSLTTLVNLRHRCGGCGRRMDRHLLSGSEKTSLWVRRLAYFAGSVAFAAGAVVLYLKYRALSG